jgi:2,3-dihydroxybiphenyl 1,2-dioxygenase
LIKKRNQFLLARRKTMPANPVNASLSSPPAVPEMRSTGAACGLALGYLVFAVRKPLRWDRFCRDMLGLPEGVANPDGSRGYRMDGMLQRLIVAEGAEDDLVALGLTCEDDTALDGCAARLRCMHIPVEEGGDALRAARRVQRLMVLRDPDGNAVELAVGMEAAPVPFTSTAFRSGFHTGRLGMGHAVLVSHRLEAMEAFYTGALGFGVSERLATRVGPMEIKGIFLHCNERHHSVAIFDMPLQKRLQHFMLQAEDLCDVGMAFERAKRGKVPISLDLGQHPHPDGTISFYGITPSGFDFEIGAGCKEIEPRGWQPLRTSVTSSWGHKPSLRLQMKMAARMIARTITGASRTTS